MGKGVPFNYTQLPLPNALVPTIDVQYFEQFVLIRNASQVPDNGRNLSNVHILVAVMVED